MREVQSEIEIDAPPERVWEVLTDFEAYPDWNPFMRYMRGDLREGGKFETRIEPPEGRGMTFKPTITRVDPPRELRWLGRMMLPRIADGEHAFELHPLDGGRTRLVQREQFRGVLVPILWRMMGKRTEAGFEAMNEALKARAEVGAGSTPGGDGSD